jgi:antitoxin component of MazEF toxin-antitoxin module
MNTKIQKSGNSFSLYLPKFIIKKAKIKKGSEVFVDFQDDKIIITPSKKTLTLKEMLKGYDLKSMRHDPIDFGPDIGREIID